MQTFLSPARLAYLSKGSYFINAHMYKKIRDSTDVGKIEVGTPIPHKAGKSRQMHVGYKYDLKSEAFQDPLFYIDTRHILLILSYHLLLGAYCLTKLCYVQHYVQCTTSRA